MASAAARPAFTFRLTPKPPRSKSHPHAKPCAVSPPLRKHTQFIRFIVSRSIDVSKEDKSISDSDSKPEPLVMATEETAKTTTTAAEEDAKFDKRRLEEKFAVLNTGIYECRSCGYLYNEAMGDPSYPIPAGLPFNRMPEDWRCPTCGAAKNFFESKSVEIAGFAENQQYGFGGNALTSGQKALLIYGSLLFSFILFLSGYFLQ